MARANGIPANDVYQFDESRQSNRASANVSGLRFSRRSDTVSVPFASSEE